MATGYIAIFVASKDTAASAWARANSDVECCVHADLSQLVQQVRKLPGQDLIGICEVSCPPFRPPFSMVPTSCIQVTNYLGRPDTVDKHMD